MAKIPTTDRKFYDTEKKVNTLSAYAGALLPAAKQLQETIKEQQNIKMDALSIDARMKMTDATNEWRLQNQSNPNDPNALQDLQNQYDSILSEYRGQIDPLYRGQWDIAGNKLKGAFDMQNQTWAFAQRQENARNDIADSVDNYYKLAYSYGQSGNIAQALADYGTSYEKLLDYGAKNLGTETAAQLLKDYQSNFYTSYLDGLIEKNPSQAIKMMNSKEFQGILSSRDATRYKKYAEAQQKHLKAVDYKNTYLSFMENPTKEGYDKLIKMNPNMGEKRKKQLDNKLKEIPNYEAVTKYSSSERARQKALEFTRALEGNEDLNEAWLDKLADYRSYLYEQNQKGEISKEDMQKFSSLAINSLNDRIFAKQVNEAMGGQSVFDRVKNWALRPFESEAITNLGNEAILGATDALLKGDVDGAKKIYSDAQRQAVKIRYGNFIRTDNGARISFSELKEGDSFYNPITQQKYIFAGYGFDDFLVKVDTSGDDLWEL